MFYLLVACHLHLWQAKGLITPSILWMGGAHGSGTRVSRKSLIEEGGSSPTWEGPPTGC